MSLVSLFNFNVTAFCHPFSHNVTEECIAGAEELDSRVTPLMIFYWAAGASALATLALRVGHCATHHRDYFPTSYQQMKPGDVALDGGEVSTRAPRRYIWIDNLERVVYGSVITGLSMTLGGLFTTMSKVARVENCQQWGQSLENSTCPNVVRGLVKMVLG